ncbi:MAG: CHASE domain-containing protein [Syntrophobacteraceae bacterium]
MALEWIPRISSAERTRYEEMGQMQEVPDFLITERDPKGDTIPAGVRQTYYHVFYVEPREGNERAIGYDLGSDPIRRAALERARDTGAPSVTERIRLVQEPGEQFGFLVFLPVYRKEMPTETVEQRRAALEGFTLGVFRAGNVMGAALESTEPLGLPFDLLDLSATAERHLLHHWSARLDTKDSRMSRFFPIPPRYLGQFAFAGREWGVEITASQAYMERHYLFACWLVLPIGFLLTLVLTFYLRAILGQRVRLERAVLERTSELGESEQRFRTIFDSVNDAVLVLDLPTGAIFDVNRCMCEWYGYTRDEACQLDISALATGESPFSRQDILQWMEKAARGEPQVFDWHAKDKAGRFFWMELNLRRTTVAGKERLLVTARDITARKQAAEALEQSEEKYRFVVTTVRLISK